MAKAKSKAPPRWHTGLTGDDFGKLAPNDPGPIPDFLKVKNRKPLTPEQQAKLDASAKAQVQEERTDWRKPKSMSWEDWDALQAKEANKKQANNAERFAKLQAEHPREPTARSKARAAEGMLDAHHFAPLCGCPAKVVRRALRTLKTLPKHSAGWVFPKEDEAKVVAVVKDYLANGGKGRKVAATNDKAIAKKNTAKAMIASSKAKAEQAVKQDNTTKQAVEKMLAKLPVKEKSKK